MKYPITLVLRVMNKELHISPLFIFVLGFAFSCTFQNPTEEKEQEEAKILSLFIDEMAIPFPLPPMPSKDSLEKKIKETNWDSIKKVKTTVVVDTIMFRTDKSFELPLQFHEFQVLVDSIRNKPSKPVKKEIIHSEEGHQLIFGNSLEDFQGDYPQMVFISRVAFNDDFDRAAVYAGHTSGKLSGYLNLYLLVKKDESWQIIFKENVEVS